MLPKLISTALLLLMGAIVAPLAVHLGLPLPYLLGPLIASGTIAILRPQILPAGYAFPQRIRIVFIGLIGLMIGAQITPELFSDPTALALRAVALAAFVTLAQLGNAYIFQRLGGYDRATAYCAGAPGGLFESIALGEESGADPARLMLQQFLRVIFVVSALPVALSLWLGTPVGSSAGLSFARETTDWVALPGIGITLGLGIVAGHLLRLPARQLTGPLLLAAAVTLSGLLVIELPQWLVNAAQIIIGTALGLRFTGLDRKLLLKATWLSFLSVTLMMALAGGFAALLLPLGDEPFDVVLISFAPGGLTEMALIALSLEANPAFVTLHHIIRILLTVAGLGVLSRRWRREKL